jgi:hypothetical protein
MGSMTAMAIAEALPIDEALAYHLRVNHYPPIPLEMVEVCKNAIEAFHELDWHRKIDLPIGVSYRGLTTAPASAIVEAHHLDAWIEIEED